MKPIILCIMDGVGIRESSHGNAVKMAKTPNLDYLLSKYPHSLLEASETSVGLPKGQMGNSEVGHMNIGTGRIITQSLERINKAINDGSLSKNKNLNDVINHVIKNNSNLHICGLLSDGGIHSHINHLFGLIDILKDKNVKNVYYHIFTDGRDTKPNVSLKYLDMLDKKIKETNIGNIATISGRYYAMDRDNRWDRIQKTYIEMTQKTKVYSSYKEVIESNYKQEITDEFIIPSSLTETVISENDGIIVFNFRPDRIRELFTVFSNKDFNEFSRPFINNLKIVTMMPVDKNVKCTNMFSHQIVTNYLGEILEKNNLKQLRIAETEKYAHVTYFFDGENNKKFENCDQILISSPKVTTYDLAPEMSAYKITDKLLEIIDKYDVIILNFANGDMVGHTGNLEASIKAVKTVDECIGKIYEKIISLNGTMIITADHGNCDYMLDDENNIITTHSLSKVPFIITNEKLSLKNGKLSDIAPTILNLLNLNIPDEMTGEILIKE